MRKVVKKEVLRTEIVDRDDIAYAIRVVRAVDAFSGEWTCTKCGSSGASRSPSSSIEAAIKAARLHLGPHHKMVHGGNWIDDKV